MLRAISYAIDYQNAMVAGKLTESMMRDRGEDYPVNWAIIAREVKEANNWRCLCCDKLCRRPGEMFLGWQYTLTVAHISQVYDAPVITVAALCLPCHLKMDAPYSWWARRRHLRIRRQRAGQLELSY